MISDGCIPISDIDNAAVLGPSGIMIAPYGEHSFAELKTHYKAKIKELESEAFLLENMTLMSDLRAALLSCIKAEKRTYAILEIDDEMLTSSELPADAALITLQNMGLMGFGVKSEDEETVINTVCRLVRFAKIPIFAVLSLKALEEVTASGITAVECGKYYVCSVSGEERETALTLANERQAFFLEHDTTEISDPIPCEANMDETLCDISQKAYDVLKIEINTPDDVMAFVEDAHMATLPVMFSCEDDVSLLLALMLYQGRALIDSECELDEGTAEKAIRKYGAVLY